MNTKDLQKPVLSIGFLCLGTAAFLIIRTSPPMAPWYGIYQTFWLPIILIGVGLGFLLFGRRYSWVRLFGAVVTIAAVGLIPLQWGTYFGIRDGWIHLSMVNGGYLADNPYPAFHSAVDVVSALTGIGAYTVLNLTPIYASFLGIILVAALAYRLSDGALEFASLAALAIIPVVTMDHIGRPFVFVPSVVSAAILVTLLSRSKQTGRLATAIAGMLIAIWHPTALIVFLVIATGVTGVRFLAPYVKSIDLSSWELGKASTLTSPAILGVLVGFLFVYVFYFTGLGISAIERLIGEQLINNGSTPGQSSTGPDTPIIIRALNHLSDLLIRTAMVIITGSLAVIGVVASDRSDSNRVFALGSLVGAGALVSIFVAIDLTNVTGFGVQRAVPIAPIVLLMGAIVGLYEIQKRDYRASIVTTGIILIVGLVMMYPAPLTGTQPITSTSGDIQRTAWVVEYGSTPLIDSQNTYVIAEALYGPAAADDLADGKRWSYQRARRGTSDAWKVSPPEDGGLYVIHGLTRQYVIEIRGEGSDLAVFEARNQRVYTSGNSDIYWTRANISSAN